MHVVVATGIALVALSLPQGARGEAPSPEERAVDLCREQMSLGEGNGVTAAFKPVLKSLASSDWQRNVDALEVLRQLAARKWVWISDTLGSASGERRCPVAQVFLAASAQTLERLLRRVPAQRRIDLLSRIEILDLGPVASPTLQSAIEDARPAIEDERYGRRAPLMKTDVVNGMNKVKPKVAACFRRFHVPGTVSVNVAIARSGDVSSATTVGAFASTPTGACVEAAVKTATFPKSDGLTTAYPFELK
jgi:hypothetical protein